jgi:predicted  nucleic acid-binding Zn-ribbon protein
MAENMSHLLLAVKVSSEIHTLREELDEIPVKVREIEGELKNLQEEYSAKKTQAEKIESEKRKLHQEIQAEATHLEEKENRLNAIKTQKEYQAVVREITMAKTSNREKQDRITQLEKDLGSYTQVLAPLEEQLKNLKSRLEQEKSSIQGTLESLGTRIQSLETQLHEQLQALPDDIRQKYQRIGKSVQPPAASANGGTCHGCYMHLPPQLFIEIQRGHQVHSCPNCHRLLYLEA